MVKLTVQLALAFWRYLTSTGYFSKCILSLLNNFPSQFASAHVNSKVGRCKARVSISPCQKHNDQARAWAWTLNSWTWVHSAIQLDQQMVYLDGHPLNNKIKITIKWMIAKNSNGLPDILNSSWVCYFYSTNFKVSFL